MDGEEFRELSQISSLLEPMVKWLEPVLEPLTDDQILDLFDQVLNRRFESDHPLVEAVVIVLSSQESFRNLPLEGQESFFEMLILTIGLAISNEFVRRYNLAQGQKWEIVQKWLLTGEITKEEAKKIPRSRQFKGMRNPDALGSDEDEENENHSIFWTK